MGHLRLYGSLKPLLSGVLILLVWLVGATPARAQVPMDTTAFQEKPRFFLPVEFGDGTLFRNNTPYIGTVRLTPMLAFGTQSQHRLGLITGIAFGTTGNLVLGGLRAQTRIKTFEIGAFELAHLNFAFEMLLGSENERLSEATRDSISVQQVVETVDYESIGGALIFSVSDLVQFTGRLGYNQRLDGAFFEFSLGTDLRTLFRLGTSGDERARPISVLETECSSDLFAEARVKAQASFFDDPAHLQKVDAFIEKEKNDFLLQPTLGKAKRLLEKEDLGILARQMDETLDYARESSACAAAQVDDLPARTLLRIFYEAWEQAVSLSSPEG